jgi:hypothetical protein
MKTTNIGLRVLLGVAAVYHVIIGLAGLFMKGRAEELARSLFGINLEATPGLLWILNPFAAYMTAFGVMLAVTATNPLRFRPLVFVAAGLFALRVVQRIIFLTSADGALKAVASPGHNLLHLAVVSIMGLAMVVLALRIKPRIS